MGRRQPPFRQRGASLLNLEFRFMLGSFGESVQDNQWRTGVQRKEEKHRLPQKVQLQTGRKIGQNLGDNKVELFHLGRTDLSLGPDDQVQTIHIILSNRLMLKSKLNLTLYSSDQRPDHLTNYRINSRTLQIIKPLNLDKITKLTNIGHCNIYKYIINDFIRLIKWRIFILKQF